MTYSSRDSGSSCFVESANANETFDVHHLVTAEVVIFLQKSSCFVYFVINVTVTLSSARTVRFSIKKKKKEKSLFLGLSYIMYVNDFYYYLPRRIWNAFSYWHPPFRFRIYRLLLPWYLKRYLVRTGSLKDLHARLQTISDLNCISCELVIMICNEKHSI